MAEPISRLVSGTATIRIPTDWERFREVYLSVALVRPPSNPYLNKNWTPNRSRYGTVVILSAEGYVTHSYPVEFDLQKFTLYQLQVSQNMLALICALEAILQTFVNLAAAIPETVPLDKFNPIEGFKYTAIDFNRCVVTCYADTALFISLIPVEMEQCKDTDGLPEPPPPPPPPPPLLPPGTPLDGSNGSPFLTPPQDGEPENLNQPFPIDLAEPSSPFPVGERCQIMTIVLKWIDSRSGEPKTREPITFYGELEGVEQRNEQFLGAPRPVRFADIVVLTHGIGRGGCRDEIIEVSAGSHYIGANSLTYELS